MIGEMWKVEVDCWTSLVKRNLPHRRTMRCPPVKRRPTDVGGLWRLAFASSSGCISVVFGGRYGGRAESGMKKSLSQGIVAIGCVPRARRNRYPVKVSGLADEDICSVGWYSESKNLKARS